MNFSTQLDQETARHHISRNTGLVILATPLVLTFFFALFLTIPATRQFTKLMLTENQPVELLTFFSLMAASVFSLMLALKAQKNKERALVPFFYAFFSLLTFLVAMEEIAWGQWFLGFQTPEYFQESNQQNELTLHNLEGVHGRTEFMRLAFGLLGLLGLGLKRVAFFKNLTPSLLLITWFGLITVTTIPDIWNDYTDSYNNFDAIFDFLSELNEMLIGFACLIFVSLNSLLLQHKWLTPSSVS